MLRDKASTYGHSAKMSDRFAGGGLCWYRYTLKMCSTRKMCNGNPSFHRIMLQLQHRTSDGVSQINRLRRGQLLLASPQDINTPGIGRNLSVAVEAINPS